MWYTQGQVPDRSEERPGNSDKAIVLYRNLVQVKHAEGPARRGPMGVICDPEQSECIHVPTVDDEGGIAERRIRFFSLRLGVTYGSQRVR